MTNARASRAKRAAAPKPATRISAGDLERHQRMLARYREGQQLAQEAQRLQARANELAAAFKVWAEELHERYEIPAGRGGVDEDGSITRGPV